MPRISVAALLSAATFALSLVASSGASIIWPLTLASLLVAVAIAPRAVDSIPEGRSDRMSVIGLLPISFVMLVALATSVSLAAWYVDVGVLATDASARTTWAALLAVIAVVAAMRGGRVSLVQGDVAAGLLGGAVLALGLIVALIQPFQTWGLATAGGTDFNRHLVFMKQLTLAGALEYDTSDYPRGIHSLVALVWKASGGSTYLEAWAAFEATAWLMLTLLIFAAGVVTFRLMDLLATRQRILRIVAWVLVLATFLQSMWVTAMFKQGFVTSLLAGLVVISLVAASTDSQGRWLGTPWSLAWIAVSTAVMAHTWTLLVPPLVAAGVVGAAIWAWRTLHGTPVTSSWLRPLLVVVLGAVVALPAVLGLIRGRATDDSMTSVLATPGYSGLEFPEWWWIIAAMLALLAVVRLAMGTSWPIAALIISMVIPLVATSAYVASAGPGVAGGLNYYALKTLWTLHVIVLPLAIVGLSLVLLWTRNWLTSAERGVPRLLRVGVVAVVGVLVLASVAGRVSATRSQLKAGIVDGFSTVPFQPPAISYLEGLGLQGQGSDRIIVWGIAPAGTPRDIEATKIGIADRLVREGTAWLGFETLEGDPLNRAVIVRDVDVACAYLKEFPDAVRVTGPNPATGAEWLVAGGCPESVVLPELWIPVELDKEWLTGTGLDVLPYDYPSFEELQTYRDGRQFAQRNQATPAPSQN